MTYVIREKTTEVAAKPVKVTPEDWKYTLGVKGRL
jgi:hypothetical protein